MRDNINMEGISKVLRRVIDRLADRLNNRTAINEAALARGFIDNGSEKVQPARRGMRRGSFRGRNRAD